MRPGATQAATKAAAVRQRVAAVLYVVRRIPRGRVATYGDVARAAGLPGRARLVGRVLREAPGGGALDLPWHRVVAAAGILAVGRTAPHAAMTQRLRLEREGVRFTRGGRVDLARHRARLHATRGRGTSAVSP